MTNSRSPTTRMSRSKQKALGGGKLDKDTGRVEWDITVKPSERKNIRFKYGVQAPRDTPIRLDS